ncbi:hypothetical protein BU17DRAFT_45577 [Hysterangium stoloniferum]|nr:hypothetical protein BU17DRAFT_45577 [Hysterangium stoloniferum]
MDTCILTDDQGRTPHSITAIQGLDGYRKSSPTIDNGVFWLQDLLPQALSCVRILAYGYDAHTHGANRSQQRLYDTSVDGFRSRIDWVQTLCWNLRS